MSRPRAITSALVLALVELLLLSPSVLAATLQGTVVASAGATLRKSGFWRIENGRLPIAPAAPRGGGPAVVILVPATAVAGGEPQRLALEVRTLTFEPRLVVASPGSTLEIHNATKMQRALELVGKEGLSSLSSNRPLEPGEKREVLLSQIGEVEVRDPGSPRAVATVVVVETPFRAVSGAQGEFHIDAPAGKYTLKAYAEGAWTAGEPVEVGRQAAPLRVTLPVAGASAGGGKVEDTRVEPTAPDPSPGPAAASAGSQGK
jgi:hypothetical protein